MKYYLGVDIGTFESKGVLSDGAGNIIASAAKPHKMLVPQAGWAEHRANEDWWDDFTFITKKLIADSNVAPSDIKAVATSGIGPCMLPVNAKGEPLMNAVLYGVDTRAAREIDELNAEIGAERILDYCGNALTSQSVGPKILWLKNNRPEIYAATHKILTCSSYLVFRLTGEYVIDHYTAANNTPLYSRGGFEVERRTHHENHPPRQVARMQMEHGYCGRDYGQSRRRDGTGRRNPRHSGHH